MNRPVKDLRAWLRVVQRTLNKKVTLVDTAEALGITYEQVRYYVMKYGLDYRYGAFRGWKFPIDDLGELMKGVREIMRRKHGMYERFGRRV
jgi:hypothetical protein